MIKYIYLQQLQKCSEKRRAFFSRTKPVGFSCSFDKKNLFFLSNLELN